MKSSSSDMCSPHRRAVSSNASNGTSGKLASGPTNRDPNLMQAVALQLGYKQPGLARVTAAVLGAVLPKPKLVGASQYHRLLRDSSVLPSFT